MTFADAAGAVSRCSSPTGGADGTLPIGDGIADAAGPGTTVRWRAFVLGNGADVRTTTAPLSSITGTPTDSIFRKVVNADRLQYLRASLLTKKERYL